MRAQSPRRPAGEPRVLGGSLLRINPDTAAGVVGNPMYNASAPSSNASRILAYGFRNPFRFTMRPNTSEIWVADVGWGIYEEINRVPSPTPAKAPNFGWPCVENQTHLSGYRDLDMCKALYNDDVDPPTDPYFTYEHGLAVNGNDTCGTGENGSSITGAAFYSGTRYPSSYSNALFFADNARNCIWVMTAGANGLPDPSTARTFVDDSDNPMPVDLEVDPVSKDVFFVNIGLGTVNRISYASSNRPPVAVAGATPTSGAAPLSVQLDASGSSDPDGDALTYSWDTDGNGTFGDATGKTPTVSYTNGGTYQARVLVTDAGGLSATSAAVPITVTNASGPANTTRPTITGTPKVGGALSSTTGAWNGIAPISYARQWQRCTTASGTAYSSAVLAHKPWTYWRLGEQSGTKAGDSSPNSRPGTYKGGVALAGALTNDGNSSVSLAGGSNRLVRTPIPGFPTTAISAELWLKTTDTKKESGIVSYASSVSSDEFLLRDYRSLKVIVRGVGVNSNVAFNDGAWHHLVATWQSSTGQVKVYKDGALAFTSATPLQKGVSLAGGGALVLGQDQDAINGGFQSSQSFVGNMDEFSLYGKVLTAANVQAHRQAGISGGGGTSCADVSGAVGTSYSLQVADQGKSMRVRVTASNAGGTSSTQSAMVGPVTGATGNTPPVPVINAPATSLTWKSGDTVSFSGKATDTQDGNEPASRLSWSIILGHCTTTGCHTHPLANRAGVASGTIAAPDHEAPSYIELTLTATDAAGASASTVRRIDPKTVNLTFKTAPAGLSLAAGASQSAPAPFTQTWVVNSQVQLNAPTTQSLGGTSYTFTGWSDGGVATHTVKAPATNTTYTANYGSGACTNAYAASVLATSPWAYWRLGETSGGLAADTSVNSRPGLYVGGVGLAKAGALTGDANTAVSFDGNDDDVVRGGINGFPTTGISAELWLKTSDTTKEGGIVSYAASTGADEFQLRDARALKVFVKGTRTDTGIVLNDGAWHHLAVTWSSVGGAIRVYKDGVLAFSNPIPVQDGTSLTPGGTLILGQEQDEIGGGFDPTQAYLGNLDEFSLYSYVLSAGQIQAHRQAGITAGCAGGAAAARTVSLRAAGLNEPRMVEGSELLPNLVGNADRSGGGVPTLTAGVTDAGGLSASVENEHRLSLGFCPLDRV